MNKNIYLLRAGIIGIALLFTSDIFAQLSVSGQLRTRTELLQGQGSPLSEREKPAFFTSQRTRLNAGYRGYRYQFYATVQDVRVWGQDASTNNRITNSALNGLMLHEAWGEISLLDTTQTKLGKELALKIGRQELLYDDSRLLGNLDWLQQARRHDAALVKFGANNFMVHIGAAYNQNRELKTGTLYDGVPNGYPAGTNGIGTMYKSMQFAYLGKKWNAGNLSFLALKDDFQRYILNEKSERILQKGTWNRVTFGPYLQIKPHRAWNLTASAYFQTGKDRDGKALSAHMYSVRSLYTVNRFLAIGPGFDHTSGTRANASRNTTFDPLYGTPHKFWGQMDYFYAANGFGKGGLSDLYVTSVIKASEKFSVTADYHHFSSAATVYNAKDEKLSPNLGSELDIIASYNLTKAISFQGGYCAYFTTATLGTVKNVPNSSKMANWAYLMISIKPEFTK
jgi:hypothetical protein